MFVGLFRLKDIKLGGGNKFLFTIAFYFYKGVNVVSKKVRKFQAMKRICKLLAFVYSYVAIGIVFYKYGYDRAMVKCGLYSSNPELVFLLLIPSLAVISILLLLSREFRKKADKEKELKEVE